MRRRSEEECGGGVRRSAVECGGGGVWWSAVE